MEAIVWNIMHGTFLQVKARAQASTEQAQVDVLASLPPMSGKILTSSIAAGRVWVSPPSLGVTTTQPAFIEWQRTICRSPTPPKILEQKAESNH